jgi:hypothetical protein
MSRNRDLSPLDGWLLCRHLTSGQTPLEEVTHVRRARSVAIARQPAPSRALAVALATAMACATLLSSWAAGSVRALSLPGLLPPGITSLLASTVSGSSTLRGIATFGAVPTAADVSALESLG